MYSTVQKKLSFPFLLASALHYAFFPFWAIGVSYQICPPSSPISICSMMLFSGGGEGEKEEKPKITHSEKAQKGNETEYLFSPKKGKGEKSVFPTIFFGEKYIYHDRCSF